MTTKDLWKQKALMMTALAAFAAAPALAQSGTERERAHQTDRQQETKQGDQKASQQKAENQLPSEVREVLKSLEGHWKVEGAFFDVDKTTYGMAGTAHGKWVLDDNILRSKLMLTPDDKAPKSVGAIEGLWFIGYDAATSTYNSSWMDNQSSAIQCAEGEWKSSDRKIVFNTEYTKPGTDETVDARIEIQLHTDNRFVVTMFEDPGLLDAERLVYALTYLRAKAMPEATYGDEPSKKKSPADRGNKGRN